MPKKSTLYLILEAVMLFWKWEHTHKKKNKKLRFVSWDFAKSFLLENIETNFLYYQMFNNIKNQISACFSNHHFNEELVIIGSWGKQTDSNIQINL